ncbi:hypothetical protein [Limimonas halophila]|uniref:hypothetical protein n=1 Tax=Limimonas halophila TaxID=1082479 RepID=UPI00115F96E1|nr:hypothetical protein [Limimonas halophila]
MSACTLLSALASACAGAGSSVVAPAAPAYTDTVQARAAEELAELPPPCPRDAAPDGCSAVHRLVIDYGRLRRRVRAMRDAATDPDR